MIGLAVDLLMLAAAASIFGLLTWRFSVMEFRRNGYEEDLS